MQMQMFQDVRTIHARVVVDFVDRRFMYFSDVIVVVVDGMDGTSHVRLELIDPKLIDLYTRVSREYCLPTRGR